MPNAAHQVDGTPVAAAGPDGVLGLRRDASWDEVVQAHRVLVARLHPDRYVDADEETRAAAERRVREVTDAYATIRRLRAGRGT